MGRRKQPKIAWWRKGDEGQDVLFIMGFGMRGEVWAPQVDELHRDHRCHYFDNRHLGMSDRSPTRTWTMQDMAGDAMRVLDEAGLEKAHIVGVSMGGMIAQHVALRHADRVQSLTLIATHAGGLENRPPGLPLMLKANFTTGPKRVEALKQLLYPQEYLESVDVEEMAASMALRFSKPISLSARFGQASAVARHDVRKHLDRIRARTLVVRPDRDILLHPSGSDVLAEGIRGATMLRLPDAGHGAILQSKDQINAAIREHVAAH